MSYLELQYKTADEIFKKNTPKILVDSKSSKFTETLDALFYCQKKLDELLLVAEFAKQQINFYASQAITRIIIEHALVGHYLFTKARIDNSDESGLQYRVHYMVSEYFKRENYNLKIEEIRSGQKSKSDRNKTILSTTPELEGFEEHQLIDTHKIANQFDIRNILNYILNIAPSDDPFAGANHVFVDYLKQYNELSSYIHCGPLAQSEAYSETSNRYNRTQRVEDNFLNATIASRLIKEHIMMLLIDEHREYLDILLPLMELKKASNEAHSRGKS